MTSTEILESARRIFIALVSFFGVISLGVSGWFILFENGPNRSGPAASRLSPGAGDFEFGLYGKLLETRADRSFVYSPLALRIGLMMARSGAREDTRSQINHVLYPTTVDAAPEVLAARERTLLSLKGTKSFKLASRLWLQREIDPPASYLGEVQKTFGVMPGLVDFQGANEITRVRINNWFLEKLGLLGALLVPGTVDTLARFIVTSAATFDVAWDTPFSPERTELGPFRTENGETIEMPLMKTEGRFLFVETPEFRAVELPADQGTTGVLLLVPRAGHTLGKVIATLDNRKILATLASLKTQNVEVLMPRFQMSRTLALPLELSSLGMTDSFEPSRADFSGFTGRRELFLNTVIQKSVVSFYDRGLPQNVDHDLGLLDSGARTRTFRANQPFIFLILNTKANTILMMGQMEGVTQ